MPKSYSKDLWWRIVFMISLQGKPISQVAREMHVSHSTVKGFLYRYYTTGKWEQHSKTMALIDCWMTLSSYLMYNPSQQARYLLEEVKELYDATGKWGGCATICRTVKRIGLTRQKMKRVAIGWSDVLRGQYVADIDIFDPSMLVFVDDSGFDRQNLIR